MLMKLRVLPLDDTGHDSNKSSITKNMQIILACATDGRRLLDQQELRMGGGGSKRIHSARSIFGTKIN
jgi:hypothetical protein